jgi:hypothetical protein
MGSRYYQLATLSNAVCRYFHNVWNCECCQQAIADTKFFENTKKNNKLIDKIAKNNQSCFEFRKAIANLKSSEYPEGDFAIHGGCCRKDMCLTHKRGNRYRL